MFRNEYTAKIGFTRVLDRTCPKDGGLYSSNEKSHCPKCNTPLVIPSHQVEGGARPYCFTEVTLYPMMRKESKERHAKRTEAAKGLLYVLRMTLWGRYDKERNVVEPDPRTQYLVPKRTIRVTFNNPPTVIPYTAKDQTTKLEWKYTFDSRDGDQIEFLDAKQTAETAMAATTSVSNNTTIDPVKVDPVLASMQKQLDDLKAAAAAQGGVLPAPNPAESSMSMDSPEDYQPDAETMAQEVNTDPFAS